MSTLTKNQLAIRPALEEDIADLSELYTELAVWRQRQYGINDWPIPFPQSEVSRLMHSSDTYVAALGELTVGTVAIEWEDKKIWGEQPIPAVYVHRLGTRLHGHRVGATLLEHADTVATENNLDRVRLDCNFANKKLCDHYEALGFKLVDTDWIIPTYEAARYERLVA